jgi:chaperonin GroES
MEKIITPTGKRVLIKAHTKTQTDAGLYIPDSAQEVSNQATVIALSDEGIEELRIGDTVIYSIGRGMKVDLDGEQGLITREEDIIAVIG